MYWNEKFERKRRDQYVNNEEISVCKAWKLETKDDKEGNLKVIGEIL